MQNYIGLCDNHDSGACLLNEEGISFALNEERMNREKLTRRFPSKSLGEIFKRAKGPANIVIASEMTPIFLLRVFNKYYSGIKSRSQFSYLLNLYIIYQILMKKTGMNSIEESLSKTFFRYKLKSDYGKQIKNIIIMDHHLSHASGAYISSGFEKALIISCDAMGDGITLTVSTASGRKITKVHEESGDSAVSVYYSRITEFLGFKALRHEGKILGLAAYGNPTKTKGLMRKLLWFREDGSFNRINHFVPVSKKSGIYKKLKEFRREDVAAGLQSNLETEFVKFVRHWSGNTGIKDLCLSGGLFANVKLNQRIKEDAGIKNIFIFPHMGDGGLAVSAVMAHMELKPKKIDSLYLGLEYPEEHIKKSIDNSGLSYKKLDHKARRIASLLEKGKIIGLFNGRMEYGPRALGNRSIICRPDDSDLCVLLNKRLQRNDFMPFAPSVLYEERERCFEKTKGAEYAAKFMTITFRCTGWMKKNCPAVVHVDGTCRPQLVEEKDNPEYYKIISEFYKLTGLPCIINTSFNIHEEPIVCSPEDALRSFKSSGLDYLCIGDYQVARESR